MTFTIDTSFLSSASQLASGGALLGFGIVFIILFLFWNIARWGDEANGRPQTYNDKQGMSFILLVIIVIAIVSVAFCGKSTGHTELITAPGQTRTWG